jgi:hypothetical protein
MTRLRVSVVGGSGYVGGELLRLLLAHPDAEVVRVTSERKAGTPVAVLHPNLRRVTDLSFSSSAGLEPCDVLFLCLPHGRAMADIDRYLALAPRVIDLSADFRLKDPAAYPVWYGRPHPRPELLDRFVYGIPELHRQEMASAAWVSSAGCIPRSPRLARSLAPSSSNTASGAKAGNSARSRCTPSTAHSPARPEFTTRTSCAAYSARSSRSRTVGYDVTTDSSIGRLDTVALCPSVRLSPKARNLVAASVGAGGWDVVVEVTDPEVGGAVVVVVVLVVVVATPVGRAGEPPPQPTTDHVSRQTTTDEAQAPARTREGTTRTVRLDEEDYAGDPHSAEALCVDRRRGSRVATSWRRARVSDPSWKPRWPPRAHRGRHRCDRARATASE